MFFGPRLNLMLRSPKDTVQSLRLMLDQLQQGVNPGDDEESQAELKRILLGRIAELEAAEAVAAPEASLSDGTLVSMEAAAQQALEEAVTAHAQNGSAPATDAAHPVEAQVPVPVPVPALEATEAAQGESAAPTLAAPSLKDLN